MNELYNWENDTDYKTNKNIIDMPLSEDIKARNKFDALMQGYRFSDNNLLYKMLKVKLHKNKIKYNPDYLLLDEKGRKYFIDEDGTKSYLDDLGFIYGLRYDINGNEEEYSLVNDHEIMVFLDPTHTVGVLTDGTMYEYNFETKTYNIARTLEDRNNFKR